MPSRTRVVVAPFFVLLTVMMLLLLWRSGCFDFSTVRACADGAREVVEQHYAWSALVYLLVFTTAVAASMPVSAIFSLIGGFLFGWLPAIVLAMIATTIGSTIAFLLVRFLFGSHLQRRYAFRFSRFNTAVERDGVRYLLACRFSLIFPFFVLNILAGLSKIPLKTFVWTTIIGSLPSVAVYTFAGQQLYAIDSPADLLSRPVLMAAFLLVFLVLAPIIWRWISSFRR